MYKYKKEIQPILNTSDFRRNKKNETMKNYLPAFATIILFTTTVSGQVGINNTSPKSTLDITGVTTATVPDGILIPRFTTTELAAKDNAYGSPQNGAMVFVTAGTGIAATKTSDITGVGFYYYDDITSKWKIVGGGISSAAPFDVTTEQTGDYIATTTDGFIDLKINTPGHTLTLPTAGIPIGKVIYVSNRGSEAIILSPKPRNHGPLTLNSPGPPLQEFEYEKVYPGRSGALVYLGGTTDGSWDWVSGS